MEEKTALPAPAKLGGMGSKSKDDGLLDGLDDEDTGPAIFVALIAGLLVCLAALLLRLA